MSFLNEIERYQPADIRRRLEQVCAADVERALGHERLTDDDVIALMSSAAVPYIEEFAQRSAAITQRRFGRVIQLYTPLYLSNECINRCTYCGFARTHQIPRVTLTVEQVLAEAEILYQEGFRHILLVAGESLRHVNLPYLLEVVGALHGNWDSIAIEIAPMKTEEYVALNQAGVDGLTLYQETYDPVCYKQVHLAGPKHIFHYRIDSIERGGLAGMRSLGIGALLGLNDWRFEAVMVALHGRYLTRRFWQSRIAVSFPRIRDAEGGYTPEYPVNDINFVQMMTAMRLILPDAELVVSTREPAELRDQLIGLGITRMSAGSRTNPGGYGQQEHDGEQFEVSDGRSPEEVVAAIAAKGYEPVWKDFDKGFIAAG